MVKVNDVLLMSSVLTLKTSRIVLVFINDFDYVNAAGIVVKTRHVLDFTRFWFCCCLSNSSKTFNRRQFKVGKLFGKK